MNEPIENLPATTEVIPRQINAKLISGPAEIYDAWTNVFRRRMMERHMFRTSEPSGKGEAVDLDMYNAVVPTSMQIEPRVNKERPINIIFWDSLSEYSDHVRQNEEAQRRSFEPDCVRCPANRVCPRGQSVMANIIDVEGRVIGDPLMLGHERVAERMERDRPSFTYRTRTGQIRDIGSIGYMEILNMIVDDPIPVRDYLDEPKLDRNGKPIRTYGPAQHRGKGKLKRW